MVTQKLSESTSFENSTVWKKIIQEYRILYTQFQAETKKSEDFVSTMVNICQQFRSNMIQLNNLLKTLKSYVSAISPPNAAHSLFGSLPNSEVMEISDLNSNYRDLAAKYEQLNASIQAHLHGGDKQPKSVEIGNMVSHSLEDLKVWVKDWSVATEYEEQGSFPFGVLLDVYSFLARVQTYADAKDSLLKNLDLNQRTKLTNAMQRFFILCVD